MSCVGNKKKLPTIEVLIKFLDSTRERKLLSQYVHNFVHLERENVK